MHGQDIEIKRLQMEMEIMKHTGFCMADYDSTKCYDCPTEFECMKLYIKEKANVQARTVQKAKDIQKRADGNAPEDNGYHNYEGLLKD